MLAAIGTVVARVRARRGISIADLAHWTDTEIKVLEQLEAGLSGVTTAQLDEVAEALGLDPRALRRGDEQVRPLPTVFLRHEGMQDFHDADLDLLDEAIEQSRTLRTLGELLEEFDEEAVTAAFKQAEAAHDTSDAAAKHGYQLATDLRKRWGLVVEPLVDLRLLVEKRLGIAILLRQLSTRAACAVKAGSAAAIVLGGGSFKTAARARGAIGHELCHLLHDPDREGVNVVLDRETDKSTHANEQRARAFAAELLLPRAGLTLLLGAPRSVQEQQSAKTLVVKAMDHFGASWQIAANHLCNREFVHISLRTWLEALDAHTLSSSWQVTLPDLDSPSLLVQSRTARAYEKGLITDGEARAALGLETIESAAMGRRALTYLLDNNVVSYFLHTGREADLMAAAERCSLAIADEVNRELRRSQKDGGRFKKWFTAGHIKCLTILVDSDVDATFQSLTPPDMKRGKGERASIALAAHDPALVLVANDKNAMWLALAELHHSRERMLGVPVFLRRLYEQATIDPAAIDAVMGCYQGKRPSWWASWRAQLAGSL